VTCWEWALLVIQTVLVIVICSWFWVFYLTELHFPQYDDGNPHPHTLYSLIFLMHVHGITGVNQSLVSVSHWNFLNMSKYAVLCASVLAPSADILFLYVLNQNPISFTIFPKVSLGWMILELFNKLFHLLKVYSIEWDVKVIMNIWVDKDLEGGSHDTYEGTIPTFTCQNWGELWTISISIAKIQSRFELLLPKFILDCHHYTNLISESFSLSLELNIIFSDYEIICRIEIYFFQLVIF